MGKNLKKALAVVVGYIVLWYAGAMFNFFPFLGDSAGYTGLLLCGALAVCTCWVIDEIRKLRPENGRMTIAPMRQPEAIEIADRWKYPGEYAFYDMTADPEDYEEIVTPEKRGDRYFSVFSGNELTGFFCVEREDSDIEIARIACGVAQEREKVEHGPRVPQYNIAHYQGKGVFEIFDSGKAGRPLFFRLQRQRTDRLFLRRGQGRF